MRRSRMFGWDRNPLRRGIDRLEAGMVTALILAFLTAAPVLATVAGHWTRTTGIRQEHAQADWRRVPAIVLRSAPRQQDDSPGPAGTVWMRARWTAPDGQARAGWIPVPAEAAVGSSTRVWVNHSGSLTVSPLQPAQLRGWIVVTEILTPLGLAVLLCLVGRGGRLLFARRRLADWDRGWRAAAARRTWQR
jgi:hypothetical protein